MDDIKAIRDALAAGPKPGAWAPGNTDPLLFGVRHGCGTEPIGFVYGPARAEASDYGRQCLATAAYIAACHPERIARLLDALEAATRDAERLDWLTRNRLKEIPPGRDGPAYGLVQFQWGQWCDQPGPATAEGFRAAIDAAMSSEPQSPAAAQSKP